MSIVKSNRVPAYLVAFYTILNIMKRYFYFLFVFVTIITFSNFEQSEARSAKNCNKVTAQCNANEDNVIVIRNLTTLATPTVLPKTCTFSFPKQPGVCQLRLDFPKLNLNDAMPNGECANDSLSITGSVTVKDLNICGIGASAANHMYLDYGSSDNIQLRLRTLGAISMDSSMYGYEILVTQIDCNSAKRVPQDCLQYYTEQSGVVTSYNYPRQQLNNENYRVCIEKQFAGDRIEWTLCNTTTGSVPPMNMKDDDMCIIRDSCVFPPTLRPECDTDYIEIPGSPLFRYCSPFPFYRNSITTDNFWIRVNMDDRELQIQPPELWDSLQPCSEFDPTEFPNHVLIESDADGGCRFLSRPLDLMNKGVCLGYTVI